MATLTFQAPTDATQGVVTYTATAVSGDKFVFTAAMKAKNTILQFSNGHASPITITIAGVAKSFNAGHGYGSGSFTATSRAITVAAGARGVMILTSDEVLSFLNVSDELTLTYTGGNVLLTVLGLQVA